MKFKSLRDSAAVALLLLAPTVHAGDVTIAALESRTTLTQAQGTVPRDLEPRYQPIPEEPEGWYNTGYFFALSGSVARSTLQPALKVPLFVITVPLDIALLPFAAVGGLFG